MPFWFVIHSFFGSLFGEIQRFSLTIRWRLSLSFSHSHTHTPRPESQLVQCACVRVCAPPCSDRTPPLRRMLPHPGAALRCAAPPGCSSAECRRLLLLLGHAHAHPANAPGRADAQLPAPSRYVNPLWKLIFRPRLRIRV